jgi:hypothetical protein
MKRLAAESFFAGDWHLVRKKLDERAYILY